MDTFLVIGNKPYYKFPMGTIIDSFERNYRCNLGMPGNNNGTKFDQLGLCNHLYDNLIVNPAKGHEEFYNRYQHAFREKECKELSESFKNDRSQFDRIYYASPRTQLYNKYLSQNRCPYRFTKLPRTGYTIVMENLIAGNNVFVTNFSIMMAEKRNSFYTKEKTDSSCHSPVDEINILRWLHQNQKVDATMCLFEDDSGVRFRRDGVEPTDFMKEKIISLGILWEDRKEEVQK